MLSIKIWKRDFDLKVIYDCYTGETVLEEQKDALKKFTTDKRLIESSLSNVEKYCLNQNKEEIGSEAIDNVFKYVMPESIFVKRDCRVAIMCRYKFDPEHGMAVVFKDGKFVSVGKQDIIL